MRIPKKKTKLSTFDYVCSFLLLHPVISVSVCMYAFASLSLKEEKKNECTFHCGRNHVCLGIGPFFSRYWGVDIAKPSNFLSYFPPTGHQTRRSQNTHGKDPFISVFQEALLLGTLTRGLCIFNFFAFLVVMIPLFFLLMCEVAHILRVEYKKSRNIPIKRIKKQYPLFAPPSPHIYHHFPTQKVNHVSVSLWRRVLHQHSADLFPAQFPDDSEQLQKKGRKKFDKMILSTLS